MPGPGSLLACVGGKALARMDGMPLFSAKRSSLQAVDDLLASVGLEHGRRRLMGAGYVPQRRHPRQEAPAPQQKERGVLGDLEAAGLKTLRADGLTAAGVRHGFATRLGGVSTAYQLEDESAGELNLGFTASDARENVLQNRGRLMQDVFGDGFEGEALGEARPLVTLHQIHSSVVHRVTRADAGEQATLRGDGLMTDEPGLVLGIQTADCVPVLVADRKRGAVAAFHAGWRGTLRRIVESGIGRMRVEFGSEPEDLVAAIGPAIGQCCYNVGEEVEQEFRSQFAYADELFCEVYDSDPVRQKYPLLFMSQRAPGHSELGPGLHLDLQEASRRQLLAAGVGAVEVLGKCTSCRTDLFFSYRAEQGLTGRMLAVIGSG